MGNLDERGGMRDGDAGFVGVNERLDPSQVPSGYVSEAVNLDFRGGRARPRKGMVALEFAGRRGAAWPWIWPISWTGGTLPFGRLLGADIFSDPSGTDWIILAVADDEGLNSQVFRVRQGAVAQEISLPDGTVFGDAVTFVQCFNELVLFRGKTGDPLRMRSFDEGFIAITAQANTIVGAGTYNPADGTVAIPRADGGIFFANRLLIPHSRDLVAASDYLNYTRYAPTMADFRINQGSADQLVALYKFNDSTLVCFKRNSVWTVSNVYGDLSDIRQDSVTSEYGLCAARSVVAVGSDVWFLSERGVASVAQTVQNKLQGTDGLLSKDIESTIKRINWAAAGIACAAFHDDRVFFAVPLDGSAVNNGILVYDLVNQAWAGLWEGPLVSVKSFLKFPYNGRRRLGFASDAGTIVLMDWTLDDRVSGAAVGVQTRFVSRGYGAGLGEFVFREVELEIATHHPTYSISVQKDGVDEVTAVVTDRTKSRTRYIWPFSAAPWDATNINDDFETPGREDYAVILDPAMELGSGVRLELHQRIKERYRVKQSGRWMQVVVEGTAGRIEVNAIAVSAGAGRGRRGVLA